MEGTMPHHPAPPSPTSVETFLDWDARERGGTHFPLDPGALRKFRVVVRRAGEIWFSAGRRMRAAAGSDGCYLLFEFRHADRWLVCFSLRSHHEDGLFTLKGPGADVRGSGVGSDVRGAFDGLCRLWRTWEESEGFGNSSVTVYLHSWPASRTDKYVESALGVVEGLKRKRSASPAARKRKARRAGSRPSGRKKPARVRKASGRGGVR